MRPRVPEGRVRLILPEPPSANRWWRNVNGRMVTSAAARKYKHGAIALGYVALARVVSGPVRVRLDWYRGRKSGDLDKRIGIALDSIQGVMIENDSQVVELFARRFDDKDNPRIEITVEAL
jgi:Holliday junction resolvase RusA-like endonuclease